ncbi:hypothetical protein EYF80_049003 [Liparis tanakae]|uniref:Uncharacterized protein n=1 Tax=Liparis tanakae TaxID=230148 RepID=A0A4Z2FIT1_9TELE|nr:hypothetical protein EYF80_049003 [Liparis tanakae]
MPRPERCYKTTRYRWSGAAVDWAARRLGPDATGLLGALLSPYPNHHEVTLDRGTKALAGGTLETAAATREQSPKTRWKKKHRAHRSRRGAASECQLHPGTLGGEENQFCMGAESPRPFKGIAAALWNRGEPAPSLLLFNQSSAGWVKINDL